MFCLLTPDYIPGSCLLCQDGSGGVKVSVIFAGDPEVNLQLVEFICVDGWL